MLTLSLVLEAVSVWLLLTSSLVSIRGREWDGETGRDIHTEESEGSGILSRERERERERESVCVCARERARARGCEREVGIE